MQEQFELLNQIFFLTILAGSLNLLMGVAGQSSMAHPAIAAVGGYSAALMSIHHGIHWSLALLIGFVAGAVASAILALPTLRLTQDYIILLSLSALYLVQSLANALPFFGGGQGLYGVVPIRMFGSTLTNAKAFLPLNAFFAALTLFVCWRLSKSAYGRTLRGLRDDEEATQSLGKNTRVLRLAAFAVSGAFAALAGALTVFYTGFVAPQQFTTQIAIQLFTIIIVGGSGNIVGTLFGAIIVVELGPLLQDVFGLDPIYAGQVQQVTYGALLVLFILIRPEGVLPERLGRVALARGSTPPLAIAGGATSAGDATLHSSHEVHGLPSSNEQVTALLDRLTAEERTTSPSDPAPVGASLRIRDLHKSFGSVRAVNGVDLDIAAHKLTCLIGPNGAGKSTLFGMFTGFMRPDQGSIQLNGRELIGLPPDKIARLGVVRSFQSVRLFLRMSVVDNVRLAVPAQPGESAFKSLFTPGVSGRAERDTTGQAMSALEFVGLADKANETVTALSYAEQKLLGVARSLATGADVLLLDEPTSGIDPDALTRIAALIRSLPEHAGKTVCVVEHNLHFLEMLGGDCYFLEAGRVVADGSLQDLMDDRRLREAYFGV